MEEAIQKQWYEAWWGIVLAITFWWASIPYFVWKKSGWPTWAKVFATIVVLVVVSGTPIVKEATDQKPNQEPIVNQTVDKAPRTSEDVESLKSARDAALTKLAETSETLGSVQAELDAKRQAEEAAATEKAKTTFSDGVYFVGTDIPAGRYKGTPSGSSAYWKVASDANGENIIANGNEAGNFYVQANAGQYLTINNGEITLTQ